MPKKPAVKKASTWRDLNSDGGKKRRKIPLSLRAKLRAAWLWLRAALALAALGGLGYGAYFLYQNAFIEDILGSKGAQIKRIEFKTDGLATAEWLKGRLKISPDARLGEVNIFALKSALESLSQIESASVERAYPDALKITLTDTEVVIENRNLFTALSAYDLVFASSVNGKPERRAVLRADCAPGKTAHIAFPFPLPETGLACMTVTAVQRAAKPGIPTGYEAAFGQVWHNYAAARLTVAAPELVEMDCNIGVKGDGFEYIFGRGKGLVSIRYNGVQLLDDTVRPNFWRAPTNNDEGCAEPFAFAFWKTAGLYARCDNLTAEAKDEFVIVRANYTLPDGQTLPIDFAIDGAGRCDITMTWQGEKTELPEFGLLFPMRRELTKVSYLGLGPRETTADRTAGGKMGAWSYNVRQDFAQNTPVYPQECGSRTGVYSAALTGSGLNIGIGFAGDGMTFSALPYTPHELENARHLYELPRDDNKTVVRCAAFQRGVGGDNSWGAKPHADACFAVEKGTSFRFTIQK